MASFPLPRKVLSDEAAAALREDVQSKLRVNPYCAGLWHKKGTRPDTFIGLIDTDTWILYIAPCFGVRAVSAVTQLLQPPLHPADSSNLACANILNETGSRRLPFLYEKLAKCEALPNNLPLVSGSTSREDDAARSTTWATIRAVYGDQGACLVLLERDPPSFDGLSHKAMYRWVLQNQHIDPKPDRLWFNRALGFAIQRDKLSYYVRYASTLNERLGQLSGDVFSARPDPSKAKGREVRDLPKEWAYMVLQALARDLKAGYFPARSDKFFNRMVSRNEHETTKFTRIDSRAYREDSSYRSLHELEGKKPYSLVSYFGLDTDYDRRLT